MAAKATEKETTTEYKGTIENDVWALEIDGTTYKMPAYAPNIMLEVAPTGDNEEQDAVAFSRVFFKIFRAYNTAKVVEKFEMAKQEIFVAVTETWTKDVFLPQVTQ